MTCEILKDQMPDLLLDPAFAGSESGAQALAHVAQCGACSEEMNSLRATMQLMDLWQAPEPSAYFDTRLQQRMREEVAAAPQSLWQRLTGRAFGLSMKPVLAGVMAVAVVVGGATYAGVAFFEQPNTPGAQESAALRDLQSLDRNAQTIDDLNSLDQQLNDDSGNNSTE